MLKPTVWIRTSVW